MKILYYDAFAGLSGDMNLAAMLDLGLDEGLLRAELGRLALDEEFELQVSLTSRKGITGTRVDVVLANPSRGTPHRGLADIEALLGASRLDSAVRATALDILRAVAVAEAHVHGVPLEKVHFHEVGATDSIVDVVAAAIAYHALGVDEVWSSPVELGGGFVRCAHGTLPVPAPATVEILSGLPTKRGATEHEMTTPTGAAVVATLVDRFEATPSMRVAKTGYGVGHRDTSIPNLLRVHLAEVDAAPERRVEGAWLLQCNIDDMTAEALGVALDRFLAEGASDVHFTPIVMKKNRPATNVSLLCPATERQRFEELLFAHTTTLGVKAFALEKTVLETRIDEVDTRLGPLRVKRALSGGRVLRSKPELEDGRRLAEQHGLSLAEVYARIAPDLHGPDAPETKREPK